MHNFHLFREHTCQLDRIDAIENETILTFINHFIATMHEQMMRFATTIESRLVPLQRRLEICQTNLTILEMKLNSIDVPLEQLQALEKVKEAASSEQNRTESHQQPEAHPRTSSATESVNTTNSTTSTTTNEPLEAPSTAGSEQNSAESSEPKEEVDEYAETLALYRKMLKLRIPYDAVVQKMNMDGIDPAIQAKL